MIKERDAEIENYEEILKGSMADQESGGGEGGQGRFQLFCSVCVCPVMCFKTNGRVGGMLWNLCLSQKEQHSAFCVITTRA